MFISDETANIVRNCVLSYSSYNTQKIVDMMESITLLLPLGANCGFSLIK